MTLSFSRHQYVEFVFDQTVGTWCRCHRGAFEWFHGVARRVVLDNLKAAIVRAALYDPEVQRVYRECAEHYGFLIAPCRVRMPEHKGKVEQGGVHYVTRNCLARRLHTPAQGMPVGVVDVAEGAAGQAVAGDVVDAALLDLALVLGHPHP